MGNGKNKKDKKSLEKLNKGNGIPRNMSGFATKIGESANEAAQAAISKHIAKELSNAAKQALHNPPKM